MHVLCVSEGEEKRREGMKLSESIDVHYRMEIRNLDLALNLHLYLSSLFTTVEICAGSASYNQHSSQTINSTT